MEIIELQPFLTRMARTRLGAWSPALTAASRFRLTEDMHGDLLRWETALAELPNIPVETIQLNSAAVGCQPAQPLAHELAQELREALQRLHPWRKGPFSIHGIDIDTEWRSDWKWQRLANAIAPLDGRLVLDVGCGNGYHGWRMLGAGAELVLGIDPTLLFVMQFLAVNRYLRRDDIAVLPLATTDLPPTLTGFDTVFSMGMLYHRRAPLNHLEELRRLLRPGGQLVLETLVCEGDERQVLVPPDRYAGMRNVWFIPSVAALKIWLQRCGFVGVQVIDISRTTVDEQRTTEWMCFQSLADQLDPANAMLTREGLPAPTRAIVLAERSER
ncbi:tRNA 5-methoxyuridine(34)/uridine 5-oxyacetic acid(34) synthase CmoB [Chromatium okenii]|jgi:tRNA (mo5U34)-methyltransferase|uniref:tRNA 5-methoxyuridine(34)/uridine 5-oxyacetic acid(34) synthase CmoB n=1 Tax=Chromatium okenii TaxID=61644 RepID=UPI0018D5081E|nr:tRNA 5-methoxyuridine(34)/uridine 5-oxyacetic acid(34) synthase CmoB [Chromatium okenii]MBV5309508.1 tRNA 5-methoxyuridine(34)/uridine 5-oxyacetic acid(34) synthase CmoB [Chromatium okenii]